MATTWTGSLAQAFSLHLDPIAVGGRGAHGQCWPVGRNKEVRHSSVELLVLGALDPGTVLDCRRCGGAELLRSDSSWPCQRGGIRTMCMPSPLGRGKRSGAGDVVPAGETGRTSSRTTSRAPIAREAICAHAWLKLASRQQQADVLEGSHGTMPGVGVLGADADPAQVDQGLEGAADSIGCVGVQQRQDIVPNRFERAALRRRRRTGGQLPVPEHRPGRS